MLEFIEPDMGSLTFYTFINEQSTFCDFLVFFATIKDMVKNRLGCIVSPFFEKRKKIAKFAWQNKLTKKAKDQQINNYEHILQFTMDN